jgi:hypothetical protein
VQSGADTLQSSLDNANHNDELVLADGTYTGSGDSVLTINKIITIRALNVGQAVLDGENARRVVSITDYAAVLQGLRITRGYASSPYDAVRGDHGYHHPCQRQHSTNRRQHLGDRRQASLPLACPPWPLATRRRVPCVPPAMSCFLFG